MTSTLPAACQSGPRSTESPTPRWVAPILGAPLASVRAVRRADKQSQDRIGSPPDPTQGLPPERAARAAVGNVLCRRFAYVLLREAMGALVPWAARRVDVRQFAGRRCLKSSQDEALFEPVRAAAIESKSIERPIVNAFMCERKSTFASFRKNSGRRERSDADPGRKSRRLEGLTRPRPAPQSRAPAARRLHTGRSGHDDEWRRATTGSSALEGRP